MNRNIKYILAVTGLLTFPIIWEFQQPGVKIIGMGLFSILGAAWLILRSRSSDDFYIPKYLPYLLLFLVLQVILLYTTSYKINGYYATLYRLYLLFFFIYLTDKILKSGNRRFWENVLIGTGLVYAAIDLIFVLSWYSNWWNINGALFPLPSLLLRSPGIFLGHPNLQAGVLTLVIPLALVRLLTAKKSSARIFWIEILLILFAAIFFTYSRAGWISLAGAILTTLFLYYYQTWKSRGELWLKFRTSSFGKFWFAWLSILSLAIIGAGLFIVRLVQSAPHGTVGGRLSIYSYAIDWIVTSPFWGYGAGSVPRIYALRSYAIGGDEIYHAHNIWLQILLESGLLGLLLLLVAIGLILRGFFSSWKNEQNNPVNRASLAAYAGAGVAFLIHGLFDWLLWEAGYAISLAIILALITSLAKDSSFFILRKRTGILVLTLLLLVCSAGLLIRYRSNLWYWEGKAAAVESDWNLAKEKICQASDQSPENTFYSFQCSLANAYEAKLNQDRVALEAALQLQKDALESDPFWYIHWANLATYEWHLDEKESAIIHMQKAIEMAPNRSFLRENLAWMFEQAGEFEHAFNIYKSLYCSNPGYLNSKVFKESEIIREIDMEDCSELSNNQSLRSFTQSMVSGNISLSMGDLDAAEQHYKDAVNLNIQSSAPYARLALVHHTEGDFEQSMMDLQTAFLIESGSAINHEIASKIALEEGNVSEGYEHLYNAFLIRQNSSLSIKYYSSTYWDTGLPMDISPYMPYSMSIGNRNLYEQLAEHLANQGEDDKYHLVTQWLQIIESP